VIGPLILMVLGGFCMGGAIAFFRQQKPLWSVSVLFLVAFGCVILGAVLARDAA
jgi:hypothetical protein